MFDITAPQETLCVRRYTFPLPPPSPSPSSRINILIREIRGRGTPITHVLANTLSYYDQIRQLQCIYFMFLYLEFLLLLLDIKVIPYSNCGSVLEVALAVASHLNIPRTSLQKTSTTTHKLHKVSYEVGSNATMVYDVNVFIRYINVFQTMYCYD